MNVISRDPSLIVPPQMDARSSALRVSPGHALVLYVANDASVDALYCIDDDRPMRMSPGERVFLCAGREPLRVSTDAGYHAVPPAHLSRWIAFRDATCSQSGRRNSARGHVVMHTPRRIEEVAQMHLFLIATAANSPTDYDALADCVAVGEAYQIVRYVLAKGYEHRVCDLAVTYGLSLTQFRRRCREAFGRPLKEELRLLRASHALLRRPEAGKTLTQLAVSSGYASPSHFSDEIKSIVGVSPRRIFQAVHQ